MKKLIPLIVCLFVSAIAFAQGGVDFQNLTFDEALAKAKAEKKLVFVDCYTTWCGPCKHMTNEVFPQEKAGEYFNPRFVCVKFDMEKGEGIDLKKKLGVRAYPSFFIIRPDGTVQHTVVGGGDLDSFIQRIERGLNEKTSLLYLEKQYEKGKMNKKQLLAYKVALDDAYDQKKAEQVKKELQSQITEKDKLKKEFWPLFEDGTCAVGTPDFNLILANIPTFEKNIGKEKLDEFLFFAYSRALSPHLYGNKERQTVSLDELKQQIGKLDLQKKSDLLSLCDIAGLVAQGDVNQLVSKVEENAATLTGGDLSSMLTALGAIRDKMTKADYSRLVAAGEKIMANPANDKMKNYLEYYVEAWKNSAHVGVNFQDLTFEQAVEKATKMRKQIFVDCYTSWCGPCKYMTNNVFPQEKMGDYLNPKFICVKYDMEKGEGPELAKKFGVRAYPTFIILNADGTVRHKFVGGGDPDQFIERVKDAFDDNKATGVLDAKYAEGARDKEFLAKYLKSLLSTYSPDASKIAAELYGQLTDEEKVSADYWFMFNNPDLAPKGSEAYEYLLANREKFAQNNTAEAVDKRLASGYQRELMMIFYERDKSATTADLDQMKKEVVGLKLKNEKSLIGLINIAKAFLANNPNQLLTVCEKEVNNLSVEEFPFSVIAGAKEKATPLQINRWKKIGQKLVNKCEDKEMAKQIEQYIESMFAKK